MKANEAPAKIYLDPVKMAETESVVLSIVPDFRVEDNDIEYTRTDAFINKVINFLNYKLDDVVATRVSGTIIPHHVVKQELIEEFRKYMEGE